ncbi:MAG: hypothetical protein GWN79_13335, partial [Actinobacteria bacterium]|nr:hypothetical protein [Actinomycetota bacterium]NIY09793.1 hypothetical protein [Gemmatimonadota bacterium]NIT96291.1 hypothetical protein [Actinomycetota bacterium]NIU20006.1 hypothetical protein [Actinomycetota bacterium]NIU67536.1 hypothetical protein [Actinomycetota bacterium]
MGRALQESAEAAGADGPREVRLGPLAAALRLAAWTATLLAVFVLWFFRDPAPLIPAD